RLRDTEMMHLRSDVEVLVDLSQSERDWYEMIRADAGKVKQSMSKTAAAHTLLSYILQLRQICSHGSPQQNFGSNSTTTQHAADIWCVKCFEPIKFASAFGSSIIGIGKPMYCQECGLEETSNISLASLSSSTLSETHLEEDKLMLQANFDFTEASNDDIIEMDWDPASTQNPLFSSKIECVVMNLMHLEREQNKDSTPVKSLSLTAATRVHLVEPQWNPMVEAQAAARVDRLDQENDVVIIRYVVKDSIEKIMPDWMALM
ncbi:MAG: hypothetical protein Q9214_002646, partial [Letrouitia sp. 1 TL-2023]